MARRFANNKTSHILIQTQLYIFQSQNEKLQALLNNNITVLESNF